MNYKLLSALMLVASGTTQATPLLTESFDDISTLAGNDWYLINDSSPVGDTGWFQGNDGVFAAHSGAANSYIAANYLNAGFGGSISNWLITPIVELSGRTTLSFYTRRNDSDFFDSLQVLFNTDGSTTLGSFTAMGNVSVNLFDASYPTDWMLVNVTFDLPTSANGRIAFRYAVDNTDFAGDYIGIDDVNVDVPEPATLASLGLGLIALGRLRRRH